MHYEDLETASNWCKTIREVVILNPGGRVHEMALQRILELLAACYAAVDDANCRTLVRQMEASATALYSASDHQRWASGQTSGADVLRLQILRQLHAFGERLREMEALRSSGVKADVGVPFKRP